MNMSNIQILIINIEYVYYRFFLCCLLSLYFKKIKKYFFIRHVYYFMFHLLFIIRNFVYILKVNEVPD